MYELWEGMAEAMKKMWGYLMRQYREVVSYIFWGVATTLVNYAVYFACRKLLLIHYIVSNVAAWIAAVVFAYVVNKVFVFGARDWSRKRLFKEIWQFAAARMISGVAETGMLWVLVDVMGYRDSVIKIIAGVLVILVNYAFSKWVIFRRGV